MRRIRTRSRRSPPLPPLQTRDPAYNDTPSDGLKRPVVRAPSRLPHMTRGIDERSESGGGDHDGYAGGAGVSPGELTPPAAIATVATPEEDCHGYAVPGRARQVDQRRVAVSISHPGAVGVE